MYLEKILSLNELYRLQCIVFGFRYKNHIYHLGDDVYVPKYEQYGSVEKINGNKMQNRTGTKCIKYANFISALLLI